MLNKKEILNNFKEILKNIAENKPQWLPEYLTAYEQLKNILRSI